MANTTHPAPYDLHPSVAHVQAILANFKAKTGHTLEEWVALLRREQPADPKGWLKARGLGTNQAGFVLQRAGAAPGHAPLRPLFEQLVALARGLGTEVKVCPCETLVPFYRKHVFAEVKPFVSRLDLGLALGDPKGVQDPSGGLKDTGGFARKDRITHKLEVTSEADLKIALPWLKRAYEGDAD